MSPRAYVTEEFGMNDSTLSYAVIMKLQQNLKTKPAQEPSFSASILPITMFLAQALREIIEPELDAATRTLPFDDRVLAWLAPELERDIVLFHGGRGVSLKTMFPADAVAHLDSEYHQILRNRISLHRTT